VTVFANYLPGGGWVVGSNPIISYDWDSQDWTIPLNLVVSKTVILGKTPWKIQAEINYYLDRPDAFGAEWMMGINGGFKMLTHTF